MQTLPHSLLGITALTLLLALWLAAKRQSSAAPLATSDRAQRSRASLAVCNVSDAACQARLWKLVTGTFGSPSGLKAPRIRFVDESDLSAARAHDADGELVSSAVRAAIGSLGMLKDEARPKLGKKLPTQQAVYRSRTHDVLVVQPENQRSTLHANVMLMHELVHAVQSQRGLFVEKRGSFDQRLAWLARLEGEAIVRSYRLKAELEGLDAKAIDWQGVFAHWSQRALSSIQRAHSPLAIAAATLPYARGASWFQLREVAGSPEWPQRFSELLDEPRQQRSSTDLEPAAAPPCTGEREELGALTLLAFLLPTAGEAEASHAARTLRGDHLCVHADGRFTWQLAWSEGASTAGALVRQRARELGLGVRPLAADRTNAEPTVTITAETATRAVQAP